MAETTSVVVSSYNQPRALHLALEGLQRQSRPPGEILIADDGSEDDTRLLVESFRAKTTIPVRFVTQEHRGFGKARALNSAVRVARGATVAFLDGDCIPHRDWLDAHGTILGSRGGYSVGGYVRLTLSQAEAIEAGRVEADTFLDPTLRRRFRWFHRLQNVYIWLRKRKKPKIKGGNWAATMEALREVNGFDERFDGYGRSDTDIRNRLNAAGVRASSAWGQAFVFHCPHSMDPRRVEASATRRVPDWDIHGEGRARPRCERGLIDTSRKLPRLGVDGADRG